MDIKKADWEIELEQFKQQLDLDNLEVDFQKLDILAETKAKAEGIEIASILTAFSILNS